MELDPLRKINESDHTGIQLHVEQETQNELLETNRTGIQLHVEQESQNELLETNHTGIQLHVEQESQNEPLQTNHTGIQLHVEQESQNELLETNFEPAPSVSSSNSNLKRIKNELVGEGEKIVRHHKRRKIQITSEHGDKNALGNSKTEDGKNVEVKKNYAQYGLKHCVVALYNFGKQHELTKLPCNINIKPPAVVGIHSHRHNETLDTSTGICESKDHVAKKKAVNQNISNTNFTSKVFEMLAGMQSTLKDLKAEIAVNSKKIDQLQKCLPQPHLYESVKNDFNFPISTEEQLLELEKQLENKEMATKLVVHLTSRTYTCWKEMVLLCIKYMISGKVAVLYNLNGIKGKKKKFRDLNICNILIECVQHKFKVATAFYILKRISLTLAGARDWQVSRYRKE